MPEVNHKSHLTAIARKTLPTPVKWLLEDDRIHGKVLDFGCGKCFKINPSGWDNYDPYFQPDGIKQKTYDTILCTYVLCVLPRKERLDVITQIKELLDPEFGHAYISVRNDRPKQGWGISSKKTYQGRAFEMKLPILYSNSQFKIFHLTPETALE